MRALPTTWCNKQYNLLLHPSYRTVQDCSARTAALAARACSMQIDYEDFSVSFIALFVLTTTENYPGLT